MPASYLMSWEPRTRRWTKMYRRQRFAVSCAQLSKWCGRRVPDDKQGSYQTANAWWRAKQLEIDGEQGVGGSQAELEIWQRRLEISRENGSAKGVQVATAIIAWLEGGGTLSDLHDRVDKQSTLILEDAGIDVDRRILADMAGDTVLSMGLHKVSPDKTISRALADYTAVREAAVATGKITESTHRANLNALDHFIEFVGKSNSTDSIDERKWESYCLSLMNRTDIKPSYKTRLQVAAKYFIGWLASGKRITPPANLGLRLLSLPSSTPKIKTLEAEVCRQLLEIFPPHLKVCVLLGLNCLFTQQDIADLHPSEVNWQTGRIKRKRSKTKNSGGTPEVDYLLWGETFDLLKKCRSDDPERVLLSGTGQPWVVPGSDRLAAAWRDYTTRKGIKGTTPKLLRKTSATLLGGHSEYGRYTQYALGHSPTTIADTHYVVPSREAFDRAVIWLREQIIG